MFWNRTPTPPTSPAQNPGTNGVGSGQLSAQKTVNSQNGFTITAGSNLQISNGVATATFSDWSDVDMEDVKLTGIGRADSKFFSKIEEREVFVGSTFDMSTADQIYPTSLTLNGSGEFHFLTWRGVCADITDYGVMSIQQKNFLVFSSKESRAKFDAWFGEYRLRFPNGDLTHRVPTIGEGKFEGVASVKTGRLSEADARERWIWIVNNCQSKVPFVPQHLIFANEDEALHFRMRWS